MLGENSHKGSAWFEGKRLTKRYMPVSATLSGAVSAAVSQKDLAIKSEMSFLFSI